MVADGGSKGIRKKERREKGEREREGEKSNRKRERGQKERILLWDYKSWIKWKIKAKREKKKEKILLVQKSVKEAVRREVKMK